MADIQQPQSLTGTTLQPSSGTPPQGLPLLVKDCAQVLTPFVILFITFFLNGRTAKRAKSQAKEAEDRATKRAEELARESREREHRGRILDALFLVAEHSQDLFYICEQARSTKLGMIEQDRIIAAWGEGDAEGLRRRMRGNEEASEKLRKLNEARTRVAALMNVDAMRLASVLGERAASSSVEAIHDQIRATDTVDNVGALPPTIEKFKAVSNSVRAIAKPLMNP